MNDALNTSIKLESRRATRNHIFNIIFQIEFFGKSSLSKIIDSYYETLEYEEYIEINEDENFKPYLINRNFIENETFGIIENLDFIDSKIKQFSVGWSLERLDKVDLTILRVSIYEMLFAPDIPNKVAINEAVEIAKKYSSLKSHKFINGILASVEKDIVYEK